MGNTPNPANSQTSQNFKIDVDQVYNDFIKEIDSNRSIINVNIQIDRNTLDKDIKKIISLGTSIKIEDTPQESRIHCFLRLIGFPVCNKDNSQYYNPGFDNIAGEKEITSDIKYDIANNIDPKFKKFSVERESYVNSIRKVWAQRPATITASALALSSSVNTREFSVPLQNPDPFDFDKNNQKSIANFNSKIGANTEVKLLDYVDSLGNKPESKNMFQTRYHYIKPFMVDPRIDFTCRPSSRQIGVPFAYSKNELLISENTFVKRPLIEKIIRERFVVQTDQDNSASQQKTKDIILSIPTITDESLISQMTSDLNKLDDKVQFQKYLFIIAAMCKELVRAQLIMKTAQSRYYWLPLPSITGPEGGSEVNGIIISTTLPTGDKNNFITVGDKAIINATLAQTANRFNAQTIGKNGVPDVGGFAFDEFKLTFNDDTSQSMGDLVNEELEELNSKRDHDLREANKALRTTEVILGEFSGLGLCDIIAVMGALYIMPKNDLLGFLDPDAFKRMRIALSLDGVDVSALPNGSIVSAQQSFIKKVNDFYKLMDNIYKQLSKNNGLSS